MVIMLHNAVVIISVVCLQWIYDVPCYLCRASFDGLATAAKDI